MKIENTVKMAVINAEDEASSGDESSWGKYIYCDYIFQLKTGEGWRECGPCGLRALA
jgi:hypothetical protein